MAKGRRLKTRKKRTRQNRGQANRFDVLPDDVLLDIFDIYVHASTSFLKTGVEAWQQLVHVCRRWRNLVFESPRRLNLQLYCTPETPAKGTLDVWPPLPIIVEGYMTPLSGTGNVITALGQSNRICDVSLSGLEGREAENVLAAMQGPFAELTNLRFGSYGEPPPIIPESFLGGSAPSLRNFELNGIPFPGLQNLLSSANHLVTLRLFRIPHSGYISPEAMAALVSVLSSLRELTLWLESPRSRPDWQSRSLPPPKRSTIPALIEFRFRGVTEYLEELVTHIDTPQLNDMDITIFNQIDFDCPRLAQFIYRTPTLRSLDEAHVRFNSSDTSVELVSRRSQPGSNRLGIAISCAESDWQLSSIGQVCNSSFPPLSTVEDLYIERRYSVLIWKDDAIENTLWLQLLLPFTKVKNLYISYEFAPGIAAALEELVGGRSTEVLPSLQNIFVEHLEPSEPFVEKIGRFVAARQLSDHPITFSARRRFR